MRWLACGQKISQVAQNIVSSRKDLQVCCQGFRNPKPSISMVGQSFAASFFKMGPTNSPCVACVLGGVGENGFILLCCIHPFLLPVPTTTAARITLKAVSLSATTQSSQVTTKNISWHSPDPGNPAVGRQGLCQQCCFHQKWQT